ncbi:MAG: alpha/beta hydrolase [Desulfobacteraceae bacterium]|nr:alpha/beta hydrolase [Desulfobacteraceae bacterium]
MKKFLIALSIFIVALIIIYFWPVPQKNFVELYEKVAPHKSQSLLNFRTQYPPKYAHMGEHDWKYTVLGNEEKTILFLHGMTGAYDIWWQQMVSLSSIYKVISVTYPPVDTLENMSKGVLFILDAEKIQSVNVVGSSLGGYLVQYLMANHPERIEKAVLGNTFPPNDILRQKNESLIKLLPFLPDWIVMKVFRNSFIENIYPAAGHSELVLAYMLEQISGRMTKSQVTARAKTVIESFTPPDPKSLSALVIIIEADNDPLVEKTLRVQLKAAYPAARIHTLHAVGHFPYLNEPDTYTKLLLSFFGQQSM